MSKERILRDYYNSIIYSNEEWALLKLKRVRAIELLEIFTKEGLNPYIYGSVARGNVHENSDIDIIFTQNVPTFQIELILHKNGIIEYAREIMIATPGDTVKLYFHLNELESVTVPLTKFDKKSKQFYDFGGRIDLKQLKENLRVPGIDKRLVLIKPTLKGHDEFSVINNEYIAAKEVGISIDIVNERINVLLRREKYGRTGVFLKKELSKNESPEEVLNKIANKNPIVRKKVFQK